MTGPATFGEAWEMPFADVLNRWQALENRDTMARSIATLQARGQWGGDRSLNPGDYPALTPAHHLAVIALGEGIAPRYRHPCHEPPAVLAGARSAAGTPGPRRARRGEPPRPGRLPAAARGRAPGAARARGGYRLLLPAPGGRRRCRPGRGEGGADRGC